MINSHCNWDRLNFIYGVSSSRSDSRQKVSSRISSPGSVQKHEVFIMTMEMAEFNLKSKKERRGLNLVKNYKLFFKFVLTELYL